MIALHILFFFVLISYLILAIYNILLILKKIKIKNKIFFLLYASFITHILLLGISLFSNVRENLAFASLFVNLISLLLVAVFLMLRKYFDYLIIGSFIFPLVFLLNLIASYTAHFTLVSTEISAVETDNLVRTIHWISIAISYVLLLLASCAGILRLVLESLIRQRKKIIFQEKFPSLVLLNQGIKKLVVMGYFLFLIGFFTGLGQVVDKNSSILLGSLYFITPVFLFYLIFIFGLLSNKWDPRKVAYYAILGSLTLIASFGVAKFNTLNFHA